MTESNDFTTRTKINTVQLEAMAFSLGVGLVCGLSYELLEDIKLITFEPEVSHLIILMAITYIGGVIAGNRRYK